MASNRGAGGLASKISTGKVLTALSALILPIWLLAFGAWLVQVVGLALIQHQQTGGGHFLMFDWFVTSFEVVVLLLLPFHLLARRSSPGIAALLGVVTVLEILRTNVWNDARLARGGINGATSTQIDSVINPGLGAGSHRILTLFSGYLITSFFNLLLILGLGNLPASSAQDGEFIENKGRAAADQHHQQNGNGVPVVTTEPPPQRHTAPRQPSAQTGPISPPDYNDYPRTHNGSVADRFDPIPPGHNQV